MPFRKCRNCGQNPCPEDCAVQTYPASSSMRGDGGAQLPARGRRADAKYQAAKANQDAGGQPHLVRWVKKDGSMQAALAEMRGDIARMGESIGEYVQIILKKGNEGKYRKYNHHD